MLNKPLDYVLYFGCRSTVFCVVVGGNVIFICYWLLLNVGLLSNVWLSLHLLPFIHYVIFVSPLLKSHGLVTPGESPAEGTGMSGAGSSSLWGKRGDPGLFSRGKGRLRGAVIHVCRHLKCGRRRHAAKLFSALCGHSTQGSGLTVQHGRLRTNTRRNVCTVRLAERWDALPGAGGLLLCRRRGPI